MTANTYWFGVVVTAVVAIAIWCSIMYFVYKFVSDNDPNTDEFVTSVFLGGFIMVTASFGWFFVPAALVLGVICTFIVNMYGNSFIKRKLKFAKQKQELADLEMSSVRQFGSTLDGTPATIVTKYDAKLDCNIDVIQELTSA